MPLGQIVVALLEKQYAALKRPLVIAETGTMYVVQLEAGETDLRARSTFAITNWIEETGCKLHQFYSIDLDRGHINDCRETLGSLAENVSHIHSTGGQGLSNLASWADFVLLDADSDADAIAEEFDVIAPSIRRRGGIIVIDDVFKPAKVNKGRKVLPRLEAEGKLWYPLGGIAAGIPFGQTAEEIVREVSKYAR